MIGGVDPAAAELLAARCDAAERELAKLRSRFDEVAVQLAAVVAERDALRRQSEEQSADPHVLRIANEVAERTKREAQRDAEVLLALARAQVEQLRQESEGLHRRVASCADDLATLVARWSESLRGELGGPPEPLAVAPDASTREPVEAPRLDEEPVIDLDAPERLHVLVTPVTTSQQVEELRDELARVPGVVSARLDRHETYEAEFVLETSGTRPTADEFAALGTAVPSAPDRVLLLLPVEGPW